MEKFWNHPAGKLSGGQKQMLAVSRAIVEPRDLLIIDEPSKGLAPVMINNMIDAFQQLKASGVTILLVEMCIRDSHWPGSWPGYIQASCWQVKLAGDPRFSLFVSKSIF